MKQCEAIQVDRIESQGQDKDLFYRVNVEMAKVHKDLMDVSEEILGPFRELAGREQGGCQTTGVSTKIVQERVPQCSSDLAST